MAIWLGAALLPITSMAQTDEITGDLDTMYVKDFSHLLVGRVYSSTKYNSFRLGQGDRSNDLLYRPTNQYNLGIGASYRKFTLNLGVGIPWLTYQRRERLGHSRYLDAQANIFSPERATNLFMQVWKGYRLVGGPAGSIDDPDNGFRDDIEQMNFGISTMRVMNSRRFSYRAPMFHDAWQRRSQGSWLLGGHLTYYRMRADSALAPQRPEESVPSIGSMRRSDMIDLGPMAGYAYTMVINEGFYVMASVSGGGGASMRYVENDAMWDDPAHAGTTWGPALRGQLRAAIGFSNRRDQIALSFNHEQVHYILPDQNTFGWNVGNIRFNIVHRFDMQVGPVDRLLKRLKPRTHPVIHEIIPAIKEAEVED
jgi:hypothetical protein